MLSSARQPTLDRHRSTISSLRSSLDLAHSDLEIVTRRHLEVFTDEVSRSTSSAKLVQPTLTSPTDLLASYTESYS